MKDLAFHWMIKKMKQHETIIRVKGQFFIRCYGPDGVLKSERSGPNVITDGGKEYLASFLNSAANGTSTFPVRYISVGTSTSPEAASNIAMGAALVRQTGTASYISGSIYQVKATFPSGLAVGQVAEYGMFNTSAGGTLVSRDTESTIAVGASDTLTVTWQMTLS